MNIPTQIVAFFDNHCNGILLLGCIIHRRGDGSKFHRNKKIDRLDPALSGLRIAVIADIHGGSNAVDEAKIRRVVEETDASTRI